MPKYNLKKYIKAILAIIKRYGLELWIVFFVANVAVIISIRSKAQTQTCLTTAQINSDSRCLYIYKSDIYQKGSKSSPHHGHACGTDVSNILPGSHVGNVSRYLLPTYVGTVCTQNQTTPTPTPTATQTRTPTPTPTRTPTATPTQPPAPTRTPTAVPTQAPTQAPTQPPNSTPTLTPASTPTQAPGHTAIPTKTPTSTPKPTTAPVVHLTPTPTPAPTQNTLLTTVIITPTPAPGYIADIGKFGQSFSPLPSLIPEPVQTPAIPVPQTGYNIIYWTTIIAYTSIGLLFIVAVYWLGTKVIKVIKYRSDQKSEEKVK